MSLPTMKSQPPHLSPPVAAGGGVGTTPAAKAGGRPSPKLPQTIPSSSGGAATSQSSSAQRSTPPAAATPPRFRSALSCVTVKTASRSVSSTRAPQSTAAEMPTRPVPAPSSSTVRSQPAEPEPAAIWRCSHRASTIAPSHSCASPTSTHRLRLRGRVTRRASGVGRGVAVGHLAADAAERAAAAVLMHLDRPPAPVEVDRLDAPLHQRCGGGGGRARLRAPHRRPGLRLGLGLVAPTRAPLSCRCRL